MPKEEKTAPALYMIDYEDIVHQIAITVDKMQYVMQELSEGYFEKYNTKNSEWQVFIAYDFTRRRAFARILDDLITDIIRLLPESITV